MFPMCRKDKFIEQEEGRGRLGQEAGLGVYSELTCVPNRIQPIPKPQKLRWDPLCEGASQVGLGTDLDMQSGRFGAGPAPDDQSH